MGLQLGKIFRIKLQKIFGAKNENRVTKKNTPRQHQNRSPICGCGSAASCAAAAAAAAAAARGEAAATLEKST